MPSTLAPVRGNVELIVQAKSLSDAGHHAAATMVARLAIETQVKRMASRLPGADRFDLHNAKDCATLLHCAGVIAKDLRYRVIFTYGEASKAVHGSLMRPAQLMRLVSIASEIVRDLRAAEGRACHA